VNLVHDIVTGSIRVLADTMCRVDDSHLDRVPMRGPLIVVANHVNFVEVPILYTHLQPRPLTALVNADAWDNPFKYALFNVWRGIPLRRGEADLSAMRQALAALRRGQIVAIAPEGTRSHDGLLQRGHPGAVLLALHSRAPILPVVYYGGEKLWSNLQRLRRTDFHIVVGEPFRLEPGGAAVTRQVRRQMMDEIMYQLAARLPAAYRGAYSDVHAATETYLRFEPHPSSTAAHAEAEAHADAHARKRALESTAT